MASDALTRQELDGDPTALAGVKVRFSAPAFPGQPLTVVGFAGQDPEQRPFEVLDPRGRRVLSDGSFTRR